MKKTYLLIVVLLCSVFLAKASDDVRTWSDGPLTWNDFQDTTELKGISARMHVWLSATTIYNIKEKKQPSLNIATQAYFDRNHSYAPDSVRNEQKLRYFQLLYDLLETYRRKLQNDINNGMTGLDVDARIRYYNELYNKQVSTIREETNHGDNDHKLQEWEYYVRKNIEEIGLPKVPEIVPSLLSYGAFVQTGGLFSLGDTDNAFSDCWTVTFGLQGSIYRANLMLDVTYGRPKILRENILGKEFQAASESYADYIQSSLTVGYSVLQTKHFSIAPFIGGTWSHYSWNVNNYSNNLKTEILSKETAKISDFNWTAGINFDYRFHTMTSSVPSYLAGSREQYSSAIRLGLYVSRVSFTVPSPTLNGYEFGFSIGYVGIGRLLKIK